VAIEMQHDTDAFDRSVRIAIFSEVARTAHMPHADDTARALGQPRAALEAAIQRLASSHVLILAPGTHNVWAANPFCAVPSDFRVDALGRTYWGICIWDALGIPAALHADATVTARCGDCGDHIVLDIKDGSLVESDGIVHFGVPAAQWWENIAFT